MERLPAYGSLYIENYNDFLERCRAWFKKARETVIKQDLSLSDFTIIGNIGHGSFGRVFLVKNNKTGTEHAMKTMLKEEIVKKRQLEHVKNELSILHATNFPFIIHLDFWIIDNSNIHIIMPLIDLGDMFHHLRRMNRFNEHLVRFYGAQVILVIEYLHVLNVVYRDLKPENILIDHTGYLKIADFGFAKVVNSRTYTMCGTPEYIAPEIILEKGYGKAVDWWAVGVLLYEMASGFTPFYHANQMKIYESASSLIYKMPKHFSPGLTDLVKNILQTDLSKRYGNLKNGARDIKEHSWFHPIDWTHLVNRRMRPPFIPKKVCEVKRGKSDEKIVIKVSEKIHFEKEFRDFHIKGFDMN